MSNIKKFKNPLPCVCGNIVFFEIIPEIECDWGIHTVIQCPKCEELFSINKKCPAVPTIEILSKINNNYLQTPNNLCIFKLLTLDNILLFM